MDRGGEHVSPLNIPAWRAFPLRGRLAALTGRPVFVDNDAKALALGEGWVGAAAGRRDYIAMVVSTGVGGGIVCDGRLLDGRNGNAGHIGHITVEPEGVECVCGARGCLEAEASGTAIARITGRPPAEAPPEVVTRTGTLVGRAVASVANLLDLDLAVVAGSVALGYGAPFFAAAQAEIDARCRIEFARGTRIVPGALGPDGPLIGAAAVALANCAEPEAPSSGAQVCKTSYSYSKMPPSMTTTPSWLTVWNRAFPLPSPHIFTVSSSPGMTGFEKRASMTLNLAGSEPHNSCSSARPVKP